MKNKTLKIWNGRGHGKYEYGHIYVAAYSKKQAAELISSACETNISTHELDVYYSKNCWGRPMDGIEAKEPCVYVTNSDNKKELAYSAKTTKRVI